MGLVSFSGQSNSAMILRAVLGVLAFYHVAIGFVSITSLRLTGRIAGRLYGLDIADSPTVRYTVRMLGLYALALGSLLTIATWSPAEHREIIVVVAGLQLARAAHRLAFRRELKEGFQLALRRNAFNAVLLVAEAALLLVFLPPYST